MTCTNIEELLPLFAGGDLDEKRARLVTEHLQACIECSRSAREYAEASQLLQALEPPEFEEATFAAIRSKVLREIETEVAQESSSSRLFQLLVRPSQPRLTWALSTAVLLAVCMFAYYSIASRMSFEKERRAANHRSNAAPLDIKHDPIEIASAPPVKATSPHKFQSSQAPRRSRRAGGAPAVPVRPAQNLPQPESILPTTLATVDKALRLEIQTSDQNIRIIWFSHPSNNEGSPKEFSKGT